MTKSNQNMQALLDRWANDPAFREDFRRDPGSAAARLGVTLSERAALSTVDWTQTDEEAQARVSKCNGGFKR